VIESDTHCVRRLRVRGRLANPRLARQRVEAALTDGASGTGLGKEAILCVRRIAIPLPRLGDMRNVLNAAVAEAARPARDFVPANANAVLFADRAELLACLARDWCTGQATNRWWWPALFPRDDIATIVRRAWLEDVRAVPTAIARLESTGLGARFLTKLSPVDVATLWRNIVNTFHLQALDVAWSAIDIKAIESAAIRQSCDTAAWSLWVDAHSSLISETARVLITAILLERAPAVVRSASFAREVHAWRMATETAFAHPPEPPNLRVAPSETFRETKEGWEFAELSPGKPDLRVAANETFPDTEEGYEFAELSPKKPDLRVAATGTFPDTKEGSRERSSKTSQPARSNSDAKPQSARPAKPSSGKKSDSGRTADPSLPPTASAHSPVVRRAAPQQERLAGSDIQKNAARANGVKKGGTIILPDVARADLDVVPLPPAPAPDQIHTEWGGSFYLVNVAIGLEYYGDFTTPASRGLALPLWDFLALLGARMIGDAFAADPLPSLFARLSGRTEEEPPGAHFEPPTGEPLTVWLERICHEVQERVATSLGVEDDCDFRTLLLHHHAKVVTNSVRIDAHFSLAQHPIELRVAGLDRDPGWVPAGGRSIYFHYE
jgi:hypothetical protein